MVFSTISRLFAVVYRRIADLAWSALAGLVLVHALVTFLVFRLNGEPDLSDPGLFGYFYMTTATTIGYGDFAPKTAGGRAVAALWLMPGAVILFTAFIGKAVQTMSVRWRRGLRGEADYSHKTGHAVVFGWRSGRTDHLVRMLRADERHEITEIVLVGEAAENPMPDDVLFVRAGNLLASPDALRRAGVGNAAVAIVMGENDNETLTIALAVNAVNDLTRLVAWFESEAIAGLLRANAPNAECAVSISTEMMARAAHDPGSSEVQRALLSGLDDPTQFSVVVPPDIAPIRYEAAMIGLKRFNDATLLGFQRGARLHLNAESGSTIMAGDRIFYVAAARLRAADVDWARVSAAPGA